MVKNKHFMNGLVRVFEERGPLPLRDAMYEVKNNQGRRMKIQPTVTQIANLIKIDKRFVKVKVTRSRIIWGLKEHETEV